MQCVVIETLSGTSATEDFEEQAWSDERGWPGAVVFHGRRLWFGGTDSLPGHLFGSQSGLFFDFDVEVGEDDDAIVGPVASDGAADITSLSSLSVLVVGTDQGVLYVPETDDDPVRPANFNPRFISPNSVTRGAPPARYNRAVVWPQGEGRVMRELIYSTINAEFSAVPVVLANSELLSPEYLGSCALYALEEEPLELFFIINSDGTVVVYHAIRSEEIRGMSLWTFAKPDGTAIQVPVSGRGRSVTVRGDVLGPGRDGHLQHRPVHARHDAGPRVHDLFWLRKRGRSLACRTTPTSRSTS